MRLFPLIAIVGHALATEFAVGVKSGDDAIAVNNESANREVRRIRKLLSGLALFCGKCSFVLSIFPKYQLRERTLKLDHF